MTLCVDAGLSSTGWFGAVTVGFDTTNSTVILDPPSSTNLDCFTVVCGDDVEEPGEVVVLGVHTHGCEGGRYGRRVVTGAELMKCIMRGMEATKVVKTFQRRVVKERDDNFGK